MNDATTHPDDGAPPATQGQAVAPIDPATLMLPADPESLEFTHRLQQLRGQFEERTSFNFMICDELMRRGVPPNSRNVIKVGRWGASTAVASDVRAWYASLARARQATHANIPDVARVRANKLLEQLWALALGLSAEPLGTRIKQLEELQLHTEKERDQAVESLQDLAHKHEALAERLRAAEIAHEQLEHRRAEELTAHHAEIAALQHSIADAALIHSQELNRAALALAEVQKQAGEAASAAHGAHTALQGKVDAVRREAAQQVDNARQDMRDANTRADNAERVAETARAAESALREQLAAATIAAARQDMVQADLRRQMEALRERIQAAAKAKRAPRRPPSNGKK